MIKALIEYAFVCFALVFFGFGFYVGCLTLLGEELCQFILFAGGMFMVYCWAEANLEREEDTEEEEWREAAGYYGEPVDSSDSEDSS